MVEIQVIWIIPQNKTILFLNLRLNKIDTHLSWVIFNPNVLFLRITSWTFFSGIFVWVHRGYVRNDLTYDAFLLIKCLKIFVVFLHEYLYYNNK